MKFTVTRAANGWICRVISFGKSPLKEPYGMNETNLFIFFELKDLCKFMEDQE